MQVLKLKAPKYYQNNLWEQIQKHLFEAHTKRRRIARFISGNVLTGTKINTGWIILGFYDYPINSSFQKVENLKCLDGLHQTQSQFSVSRALVSWLSAKQKIRFNS